MRWYVVVGCVGGWVCVVGCWGGGGVGGGGGGGGWGGIEGIASCQAFLCIRNSTRRGLMHMYHSTCEVQVIAEFE